MTYDPKTDRRGYRGLMVTAGSALHSALSEVEYPDRARVPLSGDEMHVLLDALTALDGNISYQRRKPWEDYDKE